MRGAPRALLEPDRRAILATIEAYASRGKYTAIRARALYTLAWSSSLRLSECLALDLEDVIEVQQNGSRTIRVRSAFELVPAKAKGGVGGLVVVSRSARAAIAAYVRELERRGIVHARQLPLLPAEPRPLFWTLKGRACAGHVRLPKRSAQADWHAWQLRAQIRPPLYRWHDLRHTAISRFSDRVEGDAYKVAAFARHKDLRTSLRYTHVTPEALAAAAEDL